MRFRVASQAFARPRLAASPATDGPGKLGSKQSGPLHVQPHQQRQEPREEERREKALLGCTVQRAARTPASGTALENSFIPQII